MTKVYVAIWEDRHTESSIHVFSDLDKAIAWAHNMARIEAKGGELDEVLTRSMKKSGWLYYGCYSPEGDYLRVVEAIIDNDLVRVE